LAESTLRAVGILWQCRCGFLVSIESIRCSTANEHRRLASRQVRHRREVAAYLATVTLDGRKKKEGSVCALSDSLFPSQDPAEHQKRVSLKKWCFGRVRPRRAVCSSFLDNIPAGNAAVTRPYRSPPKLKTMGTWYCRRHKTLCSLQKNMQNCCRPQEKRRVTTHWMEQCQRKQVIHWMGQCQCRSAEYTGSEMLGHCPRRQSSDSCLAKKGIQEPRP